VFTSTSRRSYGSSLANSRTEARSPRSSRRSATGACGTSLQDAQQWQAKGTDSQTGEGTELSPIQQAFIDAGAVQCGFCTPGLLVAADEMLERNPNPTDADIREALSGNLCRCTGYEKIMDAVRLAAARQSEGV
jgi:carbon-monoxide dehydrogenase small subunit